ncbi:unnamed protein product, partial [Ectocarpus sp. 12 AP-2014]
SESNSSVSVLTTSARDSLRAFMVTCLFSVSSEAFWRICFAQVLLWGSVRLTYRAIDCVSSKHVPLPSNQPLTTCSTFSTFFTSGTTFSSSETTTGGTQY